MTAPLISSGLLSAYGYDQVAFADLKSVRPEDIRTHWDVAALVMAPDDEYSADLDVASERRAKRLAELPEIAVILGDVYNQFKSLQGATRYYRILRRDVRDRAGMADRATYERIREQFAAQARHRLDICRRALAVRRERQALRAVEPLHHFAQAAE